MADNLTERVARKIADLVDARWGLDVGSDAPGWARAALAVVADDVDGIAGVLRAHRTYYHADWGWVCACGYRPTALRPGEGLAAHQAAMVAAHIRGGA